MVTLVANSEYGRKDTAEQIIRIEEELLYFVPNTFTPDGNKVNNIFQPIFSSGFDPFDYTLLIFNRWGEIVYESHDVNVGWDGSYGINGEIEMVQDGTYTWKIEFKTKVTDKRVMLIGHVNLIRYRIKN